MIPVETLRQMFDYNYWARDRQLEACAALTGEQFLRPLGSSFPSVRDTLAHLVAVEWVWHQRWLGRSPNREDFKEYAAATFPDLATVRSRWEPVEGNVRAYLAELTEEALRRPVAYINFKGEHWTYDLWQAMLHLVNHQTYHRGQITTLLRQLGMAAPSIDYLTMMDGQSKAQASRAGG
jgi:uncharacterized damage-inducible protein DinB